LAAAALDRPGTGQNQRRFGQFRPGTVREVQRNVRLTRPFSMLLPTFLTGMVGVGCVPERQATSYPIAVRVQSDPGRPLGGARVLYQGKAAGVSDEHGLVKLSVQGAEGTTVNFGIECPEGHRSPSGPLSVVLRRANESNRHPEFAVLCPPVLRTVVVAVRADHGANLPIVQLGREVGRTDRSGAAHVLLKSAPEETLELTVDTSSNPALRPRNPTTRFRVGQSDDILVFNQAFSVETPRATGAPRRPRGPIRIR
jgi:hypothetical protein